MASIQAMRGIHHHFGNFLQAPDKFTASIQTALSRNDNVRDQTTVVYSRLSRVSNFASHRFQFRRDEGLKPRVSTRGFSAILAF